MRANSPTTAAPQLFGHPRGLAYLAFTEAWERFSFQGMQALLVLYMVDQLLQPGHIEQVLGFGAFRGVIESVYGTMAAQPLSSIIFGLYTSLVFLVPVIGGVLGDRCFGQHRMVVAGAVLMACGHFAMVFDASFLVALLLLIIGCGCLKGNITTQVGSLYADDDRRRTDAFQIFSICTNVGIIAAPLVCGTLGEVYGWHYGFGAAGIGMLVGLAIYIAGRRYLPPDRRTPTLATGATAAGTAEVLPRDPRLLLVLALVFLLVVCFLVTGGQLGNVYNLWLKSAVDRQVVGNVSIPITWFQSITSIGTVTLTPLIMQLWQRQARRATEPELLSKMGIGLASAACALAWLAMLTYLQQRGGSVYWLWLLPVHLLLSIGYIYVYPVGLALFSRTASPDARAMFIGVFFITSFVASNLVGFIGRYYQSMSPVWFWLLQAAVGAGGALLVVLFGRSLGRVIRVNADAGT
jgi:POT family proton-dependent oligopeptide transporter